MTRDEMAAQALEIDHLCGQETGHVYTVVRRLNALVKDVIEATVEKTGDPESQTRST